MYIPDFVTYEVQLRDKRGRWICHDVHDDIMLSLALAMNMARSQVTVPWRVVRVDARRDDMRRVAVIWVSKPTFPGATDYWS